MSAWTKRTVRIGCGAGFSGDRIEPAVDLAERGQLDYLVFECLAERTIALAQKARLENPSAGYDPLLVERMSAVLRACVAGRVRIVSNMGAAHPVAAAQKTIEVARSLGLIGLKVAAVVGDDITAIWRSDPQLFGDSERAAAVAPDRIISVNVYLGSAPIVEALRAGAHVVLTGRVADPALFVAPLIHEFGWADDDWQRLGAATLVGHLLECAGQLSGGYFADPGLKDVPDLARLGFPLAEVSSDGSAVFTKLAHTGGAVSLATCTEQLLYELQDPAAYLTPDVTADFSGVRFKELAPNRIQALGASGHRRPDRLKVCIGYHDGFVGEGQLSYAGAGAVDRARLALSVVEERLRLTGVSLRESRYDLIGLDSICGKQRAAVEPTEVRIRVAGRARTLEDAVRVGREVEALYTNGPAGGGGATRSSTAVIAIASALISRERVIPSVHTWMS